MGGEPHNLSRAAARNLRQRARASSRMRLRRVDLLLCRRNNLRLQLVSRAVRPATALVAVWRAAHCAGLCEDRTERWHELQLTRRNTLHLWATLWGFRYDRAVRGWRMEVGNGVRLPAVIRVSVHSRRDERRRHRQEGRAVRWQGISFRRKTSPALDASRCWPTRKAPHSRSFSPPRSPS